METELLKGHQQEMQYQSIRLAQPKGPTPTVVPTTPLASLLQVELNYICPEGSSD